MLSALRGTSRFFALLYIVATVSVGIPDALGQSAPTLILPYTISTIAGGGSALALDNPGDLYFDDGTHATIREISSASFAPTMVGASGNPGIFVHAPGRNDIHFDEPCFEFGFRAGKWWCGGNTAVHCYCDAIERD